MDALDILLSFNAPVDATDDRGWTCLHFAARQDQLAMTTKLLAAGASVDAVDEHGNTPLSNAVFHSSGEGEMTTLLLAAGADRERKNNHGVSPISLARSIANYDVLRWLV